MSKYEKSNWIDNKTVLKAEHMQKIEQGIVDLYNEIENVVIGNVDLSKYATTEYVDEEISKIELLEGPQGPKGDKGDKGDVGLTTSIKVNNTTYNHDNGIITLPNYPSVEGLVNENLIYFNNINELNILSDGSDITNTLQALIDDLPKNRSNLVVIPSGTYKINNLKLVSNLTLDISNNANIITDNGSTFILDGVENVNIKGGMLNGSNYLGDNIVSVIDSTNVQIENVAASSYKSGIAFDGSKNCKVLNNTITDLKYANGGIGVSFSACLDCFVSFNKISNVFQDCILVYDNSKNIIVSNNICSDWNKEIDQGRAGIQAYWTSDCIISNNICYIEDNVEFKSDKPEIGIRARDCDNIKIDNNYVYNCNGTGIESIILNDCPHTTFTQNNISITNNTVLNVGVAGISIEKSASSSIYPLCHVVSNNVVKNVAWRYTGGAGTGIKANCERSIVSNNTVENCDDIGITAINNSKISNNYIKDIGMGIGGTTGAQKSGVFISGKGQEILFNTIEDSKDIKTMSYSIKQYGATSSCVVFGNNYVGNVMNRKDGTFLSPNSN